ncbi:MAG: FAD-dependent oxidoreductase [Elusimicrobiota bacterium]
MSRVIVIGGGITGAGIFKACAEAGLRALLIEKDETGGRTTLSSSGLIHGGLRYLPYDAHTTAECCREARRVREFAGDLLSRQVFLWPVYQGQTLGLNLVESLMERYDDLAPLKSGKPHVRLNAKETLTIEPSLNPSGLLGAITFDEWRVEPGRLVEKNIELAQKLGGQVLAKRKVTGIKAGPGKKIRVETSHEGRNETLEAAMVINATGPWAAQTALMAGSDKVRLEHRKGAHLVMPNQGVRHGVLFPDRAGRYIGAYPRDNEIWIGPTDDPLDKQRGNDPLDHPSVTDEEKDRLIEAAKTIFPKLNFSQTRFTAGVRPILAQKGSPSLFSRDYQIFDHEALDGIAGLITVTGGKMTIYRLMAEETLALVRSKLEGRQLRRATQGLSDLSRLLRMAGSVVLLAFSWLRHWARRLSGRTRNGLALFKATYET